MTAIAADYIPTWEHVLSTNKVTQLDVPDGATTHVHYLDGLAITAVDDSTAYAIYADMGRACRASHEPDECILCTTPHGFAEDEQL